jgi:enediyne biosynthesis protein E4
MTVHIRYTKNMHPLLHNNRICSPTLLLVWLTGCAETKPSNPLTEDSSTIEHTESDLEYQTLSVHECTPVTNENRYNIADLGRKWSLQKEGPRSNDWGWGIAVEDFNQDGYWDIFLPQVFEQDQLFYGNAEGQVDEVSELLPTTTEDLSTKMSVGATAVDIDNDGDVDILVASDGENYIYINKQENGFSLLHEPDFTTNFIEPARTHHLAIGYINADPFPDLFGPGFYSYQLNSEALQNSLLRGVNALEWTAESDWAIPEISDSPANAGGWVDLDDDGDVDLVVVNDKPQSGYSTRILTNENGDLSTQERTGLEFFVQGMGLAWGDINKDGLIDIGVSGWGDFGLGIGLSEGAWYQGAHRWGLRTNVEHLVGWGIEFVDLDNDTDQDILVANGPDYDLNGDLGDAPTPEDFTNIEEQFFGVHLNQYPEEALTLTTDPEWVFSTAGNYRGYAMVDWNNDGYLDVLARDLGRAAKLYLSSCRDNRSIIIELKQPLPNSSAIGARIWVTIDGQDIQFRDIQVGSSNIASSSPPLAHFGVELETHVSIEIRWPDGTIQSLLDVETGRTIRITKP